MPEIKLSDYFLFLKKSLKISIQIVKILPKHLAIQYTIAISQEKGAAS